jgi:hypothetical protein
MSSSVETPPKKKRKINAKKKGNRVELEFANWLKENLCAKARRGASQGFGGSCRPDVELSLPIHFEVKGVESLNIYKAMDQALRDCSLTHIPAVAHKRSRTPFHITILSRDLFAFCELIHSKRQEFLKEHEEK